MAWTDLTLATERLTLRALAEGDEAAFVSIRTDEETRQYVGGPVTGEVLAGGMDGGWSATLPDQWGVFAVEQKQSRTVSGIVSLGRERDELELSYEFLPESWGQGLAFEAVGAVLGWIAAHTDDDDVIAVTRTADKRSVDLLARLGFGLVRTFDESDAEQAEYRRTVQRHPMGG